MAVNAASKTTPPAYHKLKLVSLLGATPAFDWAGGKAVAVCTVEKDAVRPWWDAAVALLSRMSQEHAALTAWLGQVKDVACGETPEDPLGTAWKALMRAQGLPDYPFQYTSHLGGEREWHTACPYDGLTRASLMIALQWLLWAEEAARTGTIAIRQSQLVQWRSAVDKLGEAHPPAAEMAFHHELWLRGVPWWWLSGTRTRIGQGVRQIIADSHVTAPHGLDAPGRWHIPIYTVTGSVGKTTTARLLWQVLRTSVDGLALAASDGAWIDDRQVASGDCIGGQAASGLLQAPPVQAAVFEQGRGGLLAQGVPYARSDVAILLNVDAVHLGIDGVSTLDQMADLKAMGLRPARIAVLNHADAQCRRIGQTRDRGSVVWFDAAAGVRDLVALSVSAKGALGVERGPANEPREIVVCVGGAPVRNIGLAGVAPFHGMLGEKTLEELLAVVGAAWFGPLAVEGWEATLRALQLDGSNHLFRTSIHRCGETVYVLDKAAEDSSLQSLRGSIDHIVARESIDHRIAVLCRPASETLTRHLESVRRLHDMADEFICFDRPKTYVSPVALPTYAPGSIPSLLQAEFLRRNTEKAVDKSVTVLPDWDAVEIHLATRLARIPGKVLVLINQPSTAATEVNEPIVAFIRRQEAEDGRAP